MSDPTHPTECTECGTYPCDEHDTTDDPTPHPRWPRPIASLLTNPPPVGDVVVLAGLISAFERRINKDGEAWAVVTVQDLGAAIPVLFAPDHYQIWAGVLVEGTPLAITGRLGRHEGTVAVSEPTVSVAALRGRLI